MKKTGKLFVVLLIVSFLFNGIVFAEQGSSSTQSDQESIVRNGLGQQTAQEVLFSQMKFEACQRIAEIYDKYVSSAGEISEDEIEELRSILKEFYPNAEISNYLPNFTELRENYRLNPGDDTSLFLNLPGQEQTEDYNCGPASGYAVLAYRGISVTQDQLADYEHMNTTEAYGTDLANIAPALNAYNGVNGNWFQYALLYGNTSSTWPMELTNTAISTLLGNYGVVYNGHQLAGSLYYFAYYDRGTGVAQSEIGHYVAGEGFDSTNLSARICLYFDPIRAVDMFLPTRHVSITFQQMAVLTNDRGLVY